MAIDKTRGSYGGLPIPHSMIGTGWASKNLPSDREPLSATERPKKKKTRRSAKELYLDRPYEP